MFTTHAGQVWRAVLVTTAGRREIADEPTYEAFARLLDHREGVRDPAAWVFRTAYRLASDELRREAATGGEMEAASLGDEGRSSLPAGLTAALATLPPEQRLAVFLHYYADLPVREVARLSGAPVATVKVRLHRARKALAARLDLVEARDV